MSRLHNLFHKPSGQPHTRPASDVVPGSVVDFSHLVTTVQDIPEFPVEESHLSAENRIVYYASPRSPAADRYRLLRMRLKEHSRTGKLKKLLITGPLAHDGKSTVVVNLATALAERGKRRVLVVEADLHHPSLGENLKLKAWAGLRECLVDAETPPLSAIRRIEPLGWYLLPAGEPCRNPTELLQTSAFGQIMERLSPYFDWILVDSPPVMPLTDPLSLQQQTDATLLVIRAGRTPREAIEQTIALLGKQNIVGVVLNGVEIRNHLSYQYDNSTGHDHDD
jgi:capsular exopolysaccharide synthesis family protein